MSLSMWCTSVSGKMTPDMHKRCCRHEVANGNLPGARRLAQTVPYLSSSDSSLVSLDWAAEEGTEQARPCTHSKPSAHPAQELRG